MCDAEFGDYRKRASSKHPKKKQSFFIPILLTAAVAFVVLCVVVVVGKPFHQNFKVSETSSTLKGNARLRRDTPSSLPVTSPRDDQHHAHQQHIHHHHHQRSFINESTNTNNDGNFTGSSFSRLHNKSVTPLIIHTPHDLKDYPYHLTRLPSDMIPAHYFIDLDIDPGKENFTGTVTITFDCESPTDKLIFHGRNLHLLEIQMEDGNLRPVFYKNVTFLAEHDMYVVQLNTTLEEDSDLRMLVQYTARFSQVLGGIYKSQYTDFGVQK